MSFSLSSRYRASFVLWLAVVFVCTAIPWLAERGWIPNSENTSDLRTLPLSPPSRTHWLGTDDRGRDVAVRLVFGVRNTLWFALVVALAASGLGAMLGSLQGYFGGRTDWIGQRFCEIWGSLPGIYFVLFVGSAFARNPWALGITWTACAWLRTARLARARAISARQTEYVVAARASGASDWRIYLEHIGPVSLQTASVLFPFVASTAIVGLSSLDFLGVGLPSPSASIGELLRQAKQNPEAWWLVVFPVSFLIWTLSLSGPLTDRLRRRFDPRDSLVSTGLG